MDVSNSAGSVSILVIDDELGIREGCRRVLESQDFHVDAATTLQEGLERVQSGSYDLILLDVMLPDGRGLDLLASIFSNDPDTIPIVITGYATVELAVEAVKAGAYDFISKPFSPDLLLITVNQGLERRRLSLETKRLAKLERETAELTRAKEEAEKLSEFKTAFTFKVAHELRAPVAGAISLMRPLMRGLAGQLNEQQTDILSRIDKRMDRLMALVDDLLILAATRVVAVDESLENVSLQPLMAMMIERFSVEAKAKDITITFDDLPMTLAVTATERGLETILGNLLQNAIKYTPAGGSVRVKMAGTTEGALVTLSDSGIGIPAEDLPKIGEEFFRARNARRSDIGGTGLGMSIVKELIDKFHGSIDIESTQGKGTTITLFLPSN